MKSYFFFFLSCLVTMFFSSCQDKSPEITPTSAVINDSSLSVIAAQKMYSNFLQQKASARAGSSDQKNKFEKRLQWQYVQKEKFANGAEVILVPLDPRINNYTHGVTSFTNQKAEVPTNFAEIFTTRKVVIYRKQGKDQIEFMSIIGERAYKKKNTFFDTDADFTGAVLFHDDDNNFLRGFYYEKGNLKGSLMDNKSSANARLAGCSFYAQNVYIDYYYKVVVNGTVYGPYYNFTDASTSYTTNCPPQTPGYQPINYTGLSNSNWFNNTANIVYSNYTVFSPDQPTNAVNHLKCFGNTTGSAYRIFMSVDQPVAGSESSWNPLATDKHKVGHAYLTFQQTLPNGQVIRRSIGFYPAASGGTPGNPSAQPAFNDDAQYSGGWDIRVEFSVSGTEFIQAVNAVKQYGNNNYNLMTRNCGNMCADALQQAGITIDSSWMLQVWGVSSPGTGASVTYTTYGPSIGRLGMNLYNNQSSKVVSRSRSGGTPLSNTGTCN